MNQAQRAIARGTSILQANSPQGELVTFDGASVLVNINRTPDSSEPGGNIDVSTEEGSTIEWPLNGTIPERGDELVDSYGYTHRVRRVKHIGHALRLECEVVR